MLNIDPNLEKFIEANLLDVQAGNVNTTINQAKDYLFRITNPYQASKELSMFIKHLKQLRQETI